jgi:hypothetical protein
VHDNKPLSPCQGRASREHREFDQIVVRHGFERMSRLTPSLQTAGDDERLESLFLQEMRHPGAGRFARSSTVEINLLILGQVLDLFQQVVGFEPDGPRNALRVCVVVAVAPHVCDQQFAAFL